MLTKYFIIQVTKSLLIYALLQTTRNVKGHEEVITDKSRQESSVFLNTALSVDTSNTSQLNTQSMMVTDKSRVEILGGVLRRRIQALRGPQGNKRLDLVFLVDASASVGPDNFASELRFVRQVLADLTVSSDATRVAVVTFSSPDKIVRHFDTISNPPVFASHKHLANGSYVRHKCAILEEALPAIEYSGGGTYTLGALLEAQKILHTARRNAQRAVFLLTDGYSNGGDPRSAAHTLRYKLGASVFTFGIRSGNTQELLDMASPPSHEHSFLVVSYEQFSALARRALHYDLRPEATYEIQDPLSCWKLCNDSEAPCCDAQAQCVCDTSTGRSQCLCPGGHYGTGIQGDCQACRPGTYAETYSIEGWRNDATKRKLSRSQFSSKCIQCPDPNQISPAGATSVKQCFCRRGFQRQNSSSPCQVQECPEVKRPQRGRFVSGSCQNVFNAACGVTCDTGFRLIGSSIRLCQADGSWSGQPAKCVKRQCPILQPPKNGWLQCSDAENRTVVGTGCEFGCKSGYVLLGPRIRKCLALGLWDGLPPTCRGITCAPLSIPRHASVSPVSCSQTKQLLGSTCEVSCSTEGYTMQGDSKKVCRLHGRWSGARSRCIDIQPPVMHCPSDQVMMTHPNEDYGIIDVSIPLMSDNSGQVARIRIEPALVLTGGRLPIGRTQITLQATDPSDNFFRCSFNVTVIDREAPIAYDCESPSPYSTEHDVIDNVFWDEPVFIDNAGGKIKITSNYKPGDSFPLGITNVIYTATDGAGNEATCNISIEVRATTCEPPDHGQAECSNTNSSCVLTCDKGYALAMDRFSEMNCDPGLDSSFADCSDVSVPTEISQDVYVAYETASADKEDCRKQTTFITSQISQTIREACADTLECQLETVSSCEVLEANEDDSGDISNARKRRSTTKNEYVLTSSPRHKSFVFKFKIIGRVKPIGSNTNNDSLRSALGTVRTRVTSKYQNTTQKVSTFRVRFDSKTENLGCPKGHVRRSKDICVQCPRGTYLSNNDKECSVCAPGTFQNRPGQQSCMQCPDGSSTRLTKLATKKDHCHVLCRPGTFSKDGLAPCTLCPKGMYQPSRNQTFCLPCPNNTRTQRRGASNETLCRNVCPSGSISRNGLSPCVPCPSHYTQPYTGQRNCQLINGSFCGNSSCAKTISATHPCMFSPCFGAATCQPKKHGFICICPAGFRGTFCDEKIDYCETEPCMSGGVCHQEDLSGNVTCSCLPGFSGKVCQKDENECMSFPCMNGGYCQDMPGNFSCECFQGFTGNLCEIVKSSCQAYAPCMHGGICEDLSTASPPGYTCTCPPLRTGRQCESWIDPCGTAGCQNGATCIPGPWPSEEDGILPNITCICPDNYSGAKCEVVHGPCASQPCLNGATCLSQNSVRGYRCICSRQFVGDTCNITMIDEAVLRFPNSGTMDYVLMENALTKPLLKFTLCSWIRTKDNLNYGTLVSYATQQQDNSLALTDYSGFVVYVNGQRAVTDVSANDGAWHLLCLLWTSDEGVWSLFKDGKLSDHGSGLASQTEIPGGGTLVLGQEQDSPGGSFNAAQSFLGHLGPMALWPSILTQWQLKAMFEECNDETTNSLWISGKQVIERRNVDADSNGTLVTAEQISPLWTWEETLSGIHGKLQLEASTFCIGCSEPQSPVDGKVIVAGSGPGATASFVCESGFQLIGNQKSTCNKLGNWQPRSTVPARCERIFCGKPEVPQYGSLIGSSFYFGDVIQYSCDFGYRLHVSHVNESSRECTEDGEWSGNFHECIEIRCTATRPRNGNWEYYASSEEPRLSNNSFFIDTGEQIELKCDDGFKLLGESLLTCLETGEWDLEEPTCGIPCSRKPPSLPNATVSLVSENTANYSCLPGFEMNGSPLVTCNNIWGQPPECFSQPETCPSPPTIAHGGVTIKASGTTTTGPVAFYHCESGYILFGNETLICTSDGVWHDDPPTCRASCDAPPPLDHGRVVFQAGVAKYLCDPGYELAGNTELRCDDNVWSLDSPICILTGCTMPKDIEHGTITVRNDNFNVGGIAEYKCDTGYQLVGPRLRKCRSVTEQWSSVDPYCKPA